MRTNTMTFDEYSCYENYISVSNAKAMLLADTIFDTFDNVYKYNTINARR